MRDLVEIFRKEHPLNYCRRAGYTTAMLELCVNLIGELSEDFPVMVRAHSMSYAFDLAHQFIGLARIRGYKASIVKRVRDGKTRVLIDGRECFHFCSYESSINAWGRAYRAVLDDNSVVCVLDVYPNYD